jgi:D-glycero-alpha-D-manno-heptose-7-phosphate kinase
MIFSRTPLRVSFVGGGTDLPAFYKTNDYGCVISTAIDRYVYVGVNKRFDGRIRLAYSENEIINSIEDIKNERVRVSLVKNGITKGVEVFYMSDIPKNMGLGGSSAFTVGLLHALSKFRDIDVFPERLAREACQIEMDILGNPIGKQDQYATAIGGMNYIQFLANGSVAIKPIFIDEDLIIKLLDSLLYIFLGNAHDASAILAEVSNDIEAKKNYFLGMRDITDRLYLEMMKGNLDQFCFALHENWLLKQKTSKRISDDGISSIYDKARQHGATAGKVLGAGGGGFLMVFVPQEKQEYFMKRMSDHKILKFKIDHNGSQIVYNDSISSR